MHQTEEKPVAAMFALEKQVRHILIRVTDPHILVLWGRIICLSICGANWLPWACFFLATKEATWLWFGMVIGIDHPHTHSGNYVP